MAKKKCKEKYEFPMWEGPHDYTGDWGDLVDSIPELMRLIEHTAEVFESITPKLPCELIQVWQPTGVLKVKLRGSVVSHNEIYAEVTEATLPFVMRVCHSMRNLKGVIDKGCKKKEIQGSGLYHNVINAFRYVPESDDLTERFLKEKDVNPEAFASGITVARALFCGAQESQPSGQESQTRDVVIKPTDARYYKPTGYFFVGTDPGSGISCINLVTDIRAMLWQIQENSGGSGKQDVTAEPPLGDPLDNKTATPEVTPPDLITLATAVADYHVTRATLQRAIKDENLASCRKPGKQKHWVSRAEIENMYQKRTK